MERFRPIAGFFDGIRNDPRIAITHIGLYAALVQYWQDHDFITPMQAYSCDIIRVAKISANTYHKCVRDLHDFGYIYYEPSFKRNSPSKLSLLFLPDQSEE
jgi:hypothetical protein